MLDTIERPRTETGTEPPKRWRNWYRAKIAHSPNGQNVAPGEAFCGYKVHPSKEVAEQKALAMMAGDAEYGELGTYIGAYPEGIAP